MTVKSLSLLSPLYVYVYEYKMDAKMIRTKRRERESEHEFGIVICICAKQRYIFDDEHVLYGLSNDFSSHIYTRCVFRNSKYFFFSPFYFCTISINSSHLD